MICGMCLKLLRKNRERNKQDHKSSEIVKSGVDYEELIEFSLSL